MKRNHLASLVLIPVCCIVACTAGVVSAPPAAPPPASSLPAPPASPASAPTAIASSSEPPQPAELSCYPMPGQPAAPGCPELPVNHDDADVDGAFAIDDGAESIEEEEAPAAVEPHPYAGMSDAEFIRKVRKNPSELGPMSIGFPGQGRLFNGVQMPQAAQWQVVDPSHAWGTQETVDYLTKAIQRVNSQFPSSPRVVIGHISSKSGGPLSPHKSHQAGRDVDVGYYHTSEMRWFGRARADNLDLARTWAFVKGLLKESRIDLILIDRSIQRLLREHAVAQHEDEAWLKQVFEGGAGKRAMILHAHGHADHIHVRFFNPIAQETGRRAGSTLLAMGLLRRPVKAAPAPTLTYIIHRVVKAETLGMIAKKYGVTVQQILAANGMYTIRIRPKQELRIPRTVPASSAPAAHANPRPGSKPSSARPHP